MSGYKRSGKQLGGFNKKEMTGKKFGKLTVIKSLHKNKKGIYHYECKCDCGITYITSGQYIRNGRATSCSKCSKVRGSDHPQWLGVGMISRTWWNDHIIRKNKQRNDKMRGRKQLQISIDINYGWELFEKQKQKCALTGIVLTFPTTSHTKRRTNNNGTASLDRIDNKKDYVEGNVQWVHKDINILKSNFEQSKFIELCKLVANHTETSNI